MSLSQESRWTAIFALLVVSLGILLGLWAGERDVKAAERRSEIEKCKVDALVTSPYMRLENIDFLCRRFAVSEGQ